MELFHNEERSVKLGKIFLSGAAKHVDDLDHALSMQLDVPVTVTNPLNNINLRGDIRMFRDDDCIFVSPSPLLGMAMRNSDLQIDLTSSELRIQRGMEQRRRQITQMGILAASVVMVASLLLLVSVYIKNTYLTQLRRQIAKIAKVAGHVERMRKYIVLVEDRLDAEQRSVNILNEVHKLTPNEIYFTNINIEEKERAVLQGRAEAMSHVFSFVTTLENSPYFENVKTTYTTTKKDQDEEYTKFEVICMYEKKDKFEEENIE